MGVVVVGIGVLGVQKIVGLGDSQVPYSLQVCTYIERDSGGHFHLTRFSALYAVPAAVLTSGGPAPAVGGDAHSGQIAKTRQKIHSKNS